MDQHPTPLEPQTNPVLDGLLDDALAPPPPPEGMVDTIVTATDPRLPRYSLIRRIGPTAWRMAAMILIVTGVGAVVVLLEKPETSVTQPELIVDQFDAAIDEQLDLLALEVDLVRIDELWFPEGDPFDQAQLEYELETLTAEIGPLF